ncbi:hypothetical protein PBI_NILO_44 [Mycobacterium phage Nilo]|uniref:Uncharacterized protein n=1 Tax=Mycobacterium phage Nilo TaxID=2108129 RepID=A0A2P1JQS0_9CAUD|nr:hypothetical protein PBI_NILO_44 [Mycobacterium phage Nilo]
MFSTIDRLKLTATESLALKLIWAWANTLDPHLNRNQRNIAQAKLEGMTVAANAVGYGHTDFQVQLLVHETMQKHPMPERRLTGKNTELAQWEAEAMQALATELDKIK